MDRNFPRLHRFRPGERPRNERLTILTVGGIEPRKGSLTLLEGFAQLRQTLPDHDPLLLIAGGTTLFDYRHELERGRRDHESWCELVG